jgi:hypothetical protein
VNDRGSARSFASPVRIDPATGKILESQLPSIALSDYLGSVASQAAMLALVGHRGDWTNRTDLKASFILIAEDASQLSNWVQLQYPVSSVNGKAGGAVTLDYTDVGAQQKLTTVTKTSAYTAHLGELVLVNAISGAVVITLPAATGTGQPVVVKKTDTSTNPVTVQRAGSDVISTASTSVPISLQDEALTFTDTAAGQWWISAGQKSLASLDARYAKQTGAYVVTDPAYYSGGTDLAAAGQAAINAMPTGGGTLFVPPGNWTLSAPLVLKSGVRVVGGGRGIARITASAGLFTWTTNISNCHVEHLQLGSVGGHIFAPSSGDHGIYNLNVRHCIINQNDPNSAIMYHVSALDYDNVAFEDCDMSRSGSATIPAFYIVNSFGAANENRWVRCWAHSYDCTSTPFFWIESNTNSNYAYDNRFEDITGEQNPGGLIRALSTSNLIVDNVCDYDAVAQYTADVIYVGKSTVSGGLRSRFPTVRNSGRRGGALGAGVYDINFPSGGTQYGMIVAPNHSAAGLRVNFVTTSGSSEAPIVLGAQPGTWTGQPSDAVSFLGQPTVFQSGLYVGASKESAGTGSPEGVVTGSPSDRYHRTDGGAGTALYIKESGAATTTGWVAYAASDATAVHLGGTETVTGAKTFTANVTVSSSLVNILTTNQAVPTTAAWNNQNAASLANSSSVQINGTNTLRVSSSTGTAPQVSTGIGTVVNQTDLIAVVASTQYTAVVSFLAGTTGRGCSLGVRVCDSSGSTLRTLTTNITDNTANPTQAAITFTTAANEVNVRFFVTVNGTPPIGEFHYIGQAQVIQGTTTSWLAPGATPSATLTPTGYVAAVGALALASSGAAGVTVNAASGTGTGGLLVGDGSGNPVLSAVGGSVWLRGVTLNRTAVADTNYTVLTTDAIVAYTTLTAARVTTLPAQGPGLSIGRTFTVKDESGSCDGTNTITLTPTSGTIDGASSLVLSTAHATTTVYTNGANWFTR